MTNVIFDFGNVIVRWDLYAALGHLFETPEEMSACLDEIGFYDWNLEQDRGRSWEDGLAWAARERPAHAHVFADYHAGMEAAHSRQVPGTVALIQRLHARGVPLYGLTNATLEAFDLFRRTAPEVQLMRDIVVSARERCVKPDPRIFELCLRRNGLAASETVFIDDTAANCLGARELGIDAIHFAGAEALEDELSARGLL